MAAGFAKSFHSAARRYPLQWGALLTLLALIGFRPWGRVLLAPTALERHARAGRDRGRRRDLTRDCSRASGRTSSRSPPGRRRCGRCSASRWQRRVRSARPQQLAWRRRPVGEGRRADAPSGLGVLPTLLVAAALPRGVRARTRRRRRYVGERAAPLTGVILGDPEEESGISAARRPPHALVVVADRSRLAESVEWGRSIGAARPQTSSRIVPGIAVISVADLRGVPGLRTAPRAGSSRRWSAGRAPADRRCCSTGTVRSRRCLDAREGVPNVDSTRPTARWSCATGRRDPGAHRASRDRDRRARPAAVRGTARATAPAAGDAAVARAVTYARFLALFPDHCSCSASCIARLCSRGAPSAVPARAFRRRRRVDVAVGQRGGRGRAVGFDPERISASSSGCCRSRSILFFLLQTWVTSADPDPLGDAMIDPAGFRAVLVLRVAARLVAADRARAVARSTASSRTARRWLPLTVGLDLLRRRRRDRHRANWRWRIGNATTIGVRLFGVLPVERRSLPL